MRAMSCGNLLALAYGRRPQMNCYVAEVAGGGPGSATNFASLSPSKCTPFPRTLPAHQDQQDSPRHLHSRPRTLTGYRSPSLFAKPNHNSLLSPAIRSVWREGIARCRQPVLPLSSLTPWSLFSVRSALESTSNQIFPLLRQPRKITLDPVQSFLLFFHAL